MHEGQPVGMRGIVVDITERKRIEERLRASLKEKEVLIKEIHHRVKNNLAVVSSLLSLQSSQLEDETAKKMMLESQNRVRSMAILHEKLYQTDDLARIDFAEYIQSTTIELFRAYQIDPAKIDLKINVQDITLTIQLAVPCGLIVNELVSNALKHAFPPSQKEKGSISVSMKSINEKEIELSVTDNGIGIPKDIDIHKTHSLGLRLVTILAEDQLQGKMTITRNSGTTFHIRFNKSEA